MPRLALPFGRLLPALILIASSFAAAEERPQALPADAAERCKPLYQEVGMPAYKGDFGAGERTLVCHQGYLLSLNAGTLLPDWVLENLPKEQFVGDADRAKSSFKIDPEILAASPDGKDGLLVVCPEDYTGTGYDRGHQAPAGDFTSSQTLVDESFYMTNMAPQVGIGFNRGIWRNLETQVRAWTEQRGRLIVITGPVEKAPEFDLPKRANLTRRSCGNRELAIAVPEAFYKIVYQDEPRRAIAFLLPNLKLPWSDLPKYRRSIAHIEDLTGIDFFPGLSLRDQRVLETQVAPMWGH